MSIHNSRTTAVVLVTLATFTDIVAYSVAVPVLPDLSRRLGASPTMIGLLFSSFGVTLLATSVPMGAISDRIGRKWPMVGGLVALAVATVVFAFADTLGWLFVARLVQGAADAVTWVVGFALVADLYAAEERGRVMGMVMSGTGFGLIVGPSIGGWLYELGGLRLPFLVVAGMSALVAAAFLWLPDPSAHAGREPARLAAIFRSSSVAACAVAVIAVAASVSMLEPLLSLYLGQFGLSPARIGTVFAAGAIATTVLNPVWGRLADRRGARRVMLIGLTLSSCGLPLLGIVDGYASAVVLFVCQASLFALAITPSLAYMAEATSSAAASSFGASYGLYNFAWGIGLLGGPALGGVLFERIGFGPLMASWSIALLAVVIALTRVKSSVRRQPDETTTTAGTPQTGSVRP